MSIKVNDWKAKTTTTNTLRLRDFAVIKMIQTLFNLSEANMKTILIITILFLAAISGNAAVITVKTDGTGNFTNIQQAYLAAFSGDTILVYPGTYHENLDLNNAGKNITIASLYLTTQDAAYIHSTVINGSQSGSCIAVRETGQALIVINGFTVTNGSGFLPGFTGGGFYFLNTNCHINNCYIQENSAHYGGGIFASNSNVYLSGTTIRYNHTHMSAGALHIISNSVFTFDTANRNNVYLNYSAHGTEIYKSHTAPPLHVVVDTFTVLSPDHFHIISSDNLGNYLDDITIEILNPKIDPVLADLYVDPVNGSDNNSGLVPSEALKTVSYAYQLIMPDSINTNTIHLLEGVYAPSVNGEKFPLSLRSFVHLEGQGHEYTVFDAEQLSYFAWANSYSKNIAIGKISFINGYGQHYYQGGSRRSGFYFRLHSENIHFYDFMFANAEGRVAAFVFELGDKIYFNNGLIDQVVGGGGIRFSADWKEPALTRIENLLIRNIEPVYNIGIPFGVGILLSGKSSVINSLKGTIINTQISDCDFDVDPDWGPRQAKTLCISTNANIDLVNLTIGNNITLGTLTHAIRIFNGVVLNTYNSIVLNNWQFQIVLGRNNLYDLPCTANIAYSNIEGGKDQIYNWYNMHTLNWLDGNIDQDPLWVGSGDYPYQLQWNSPCINAGTPMFEEGMQPPYIILEEGKIVLYKIDGDTLHLPPYDLAGNPRIRGGRIDMGAYEFQDTVNLVRYNPWQQQEANKLHIYPNPFSAHTFISFKTKTSGEILAVVSDMDGRNVKTLMDARTSGGEYSITWKGDDNNGNAAPKGTYIANIYLNGQAKASGKIVKN